MRPERARSEADLLHYRTVIGHFATGVTVVTGVGPHGAAAGMTTNAVCSLSLDPLLLLVCFDNTSRTLAAVRESGRFGVNVLGAHQRDVAAHFASKLPGHEKFAPFAYEVQGGAPVLDGVLAWLSCELDELMPGGDHTIGVGAVEAMGHSGDGSEPLVWFRGDYTAVATAQDAES